MSSQEDLDAYQNAYDNPFSKFFKETVKFQVGDNVEVIRIKETAPANPSEIEQATLNGKLEKACKKEVIGAMISALQTVRSVSGLMPSIRDMVDISKSNVDVVFAFAALSSAIIMRFRRNSMGREQFYATDRRTNDAEFSQVSAKFYSLRKLDKYAFVHVEDDSQIMSDPIGWGRQFLR